MRSELGVGDPIEVERIERIEVTDGNAGWEESTKTRTVWVPATVVGLNPLSVAFSDGTRQAIGGVVPIRRPR